MNKYGWSIRGTNTGNYTLYVYPKLTKPGFIHQVTNGNIGAGKTQTVEVIQKDNILKIPEI